MIRTNSETYKDLMNLSVQAIRTAQQEAVRQDGSNCRVRKTITVCYPEFGRPQQTLSFVYRGQHRKEESTYDYPGLEYWDNQTIESLTVTPDCIQSKKIFIDDVLDRTT